MVGPPLLVLEQTECLQGLAGRHRPDARLTNRRLSASWSVPQIDYLQGLGIPLKSVENMASINKAILAQVGCLQWLLLDGCYIQAGFDGLPSLGLELRAPMPGHCNQVIPGQAGRQPLSGGVRRCQQCAWAATQAGSEWRDCMQAVTKPVAPPAARVKHAPPFRACTAASGGSEGSG